MTLLSIPPSRQVLRCYFKTDHDHLFIWWILTVLHRFSPPFQTSSLSHTISCTQFVTQHFLALHSLGQGSCQIHCWIIGSKLHFRVCTNIFHVFSLRMILRESEHVGVLKFYCKIIYCDIVHFVGYCIIKNGISSFNHDLYNLHNEQEIAKVIKAERLGYSCRMQGQVPCRKVTSQKPEGNKKTMQTCCSVPAFSFRNLTIMDIRNWSESRRIGTNGRRQQMMPTFIIMMDCGTSSRSCRMRSIKCR